MAIDHVTGLDSGVEVEEIVSTPLALVENNKTTAETHSALDTITEKSGHATKAAEHFANASKAGAEYIQSVVGLGAQVLASAVVGANIATTATQAAYTCNMAAMATSPLASSVLSTLGFWAYKSAAFAMIHPAITAGSVIAATIVANPSYLIGVIAKPFTVAKEVTLGVTETLLATKEAVEEACGITAYDAGKWVYENTVSAASAAWDYAEDMPAIGLPSFYSCH
ncbi:MAG: hypothetical protein V4485_01420 [Pseudomonadota bacterium]